MLCEYDLKELKKITSKVKNEIQEHHETDPKNIDDSINKLLFGVLRSVERCIKIIEMNNATEI